MHSLASDLRYAVRQLQRLPAFTMTAVVSLALGIGATSAVFSVIYAVLINPFPYSGADRMMQIALKDKSGNYRYTGLGAAQMDELRQVASIESVVGEDGWNLTTTDGDLPEDVVGAYITPNAPDHWGTRAFKGRWLTPSDAPPGQEPQPVVVLSYRFWQRYYAADPDVVGTCPSCCWRAVRSGNRNLRCARHSEPPAPGSCVSYSPSLYASPWRGLPWAFWSHGGALL